MFEKVDTKKFITCFISIIFLFLPVLALAVDNTLRLPDTGIIIKDPLLAETANSSGHIGTKGSMPATVGVLIGSFVSLLISLIGVIFVCFVIYGGFLWLTARGNDGQVTEAKNIIVTATIGVTIVLSAYFISVYTIKVISSSLFSDSGDYFEIMGEEKRISKEDYEYDTNGFYKYILVPIGKGVMIAWTGISKGAGWVWDNTKKAVNEVSEIDLSIPIDFPKGLDELLKYL